MPCATFEQSAKADIELIVACTKDAIVMVEGGADEASETEVIDALYFAFNEAQKIIGLIEKLRAAVGKTKREFSVAKLDAGIAGRVAALADDKLKVACVIKEKKARYESYAAIKKEVVATLTAEMGAEAFVAVEKLVKEELENRKAVVVRNMVLDEGKRDLKKCEEMVQACFASNDYKEGRRAFMEKRNPVFTGT